MSRSFQTYKDREIVPGDFNMQTVSKSGIENKSVERESVPISESVQCKMIQNKQFRGGKLVYWYVAFNWCQQLAKLGLESRREGSGSTTTLEGFFKSTWKEGFFNIHTKHKILAKVYLLSHTQVNIYWKETNSKIQIIVAHNCWTIGVVNILESKPSIQWLSGWISEHN